MVKLNHLYQALILEQAQKTDYQKLLSGPDLWEGKIRNPSCGDDLTLNFTVENNRIMSIGYELSGCILAKASTQLMVQQLLGKSLDEVSDLCVQMSLLMQGKTVNDPKLNQETLILGDVVNFPVRIKCVMLPWKLIEQILEEKNVGKK